MALLALGIFMTTVGYKYAWDDQHIEIPLLKSLINPDLYQGDYYVESLRKNFATFLYPLLSRLITVEQIPAAFFLLFLVVRYFLFFWIYKIWLLFAQDRVKAFLCVLTFIFISRVDEFLYKTFSHQEFALALIFAGIYFFFKNRFVLAAVILGAAANFHALYSAFPFFYMCVYLVAAVRREGFKTLLKAVAGFAAASLPFLIWFFSHRWQQTHMDVMDYSDWLSVYHYACPQNFLLPLVPVSKLFSELAIFLNATRKYLILIGFFLLNLFFNERFRSNRKAQAFCWGGFLLLLVCLVFTYIHPHKFFLDLNLTRNTQYLHFILMGYTLLLIIDIIENDKWMWGYCFAVLFVFMKYSGLVSTFAVFTALSILLLRRWVRRPNSPMKWLVILTATVFMVLCISAIIYSYQVIQYKFFVLFNLTLIIILLTLVYLWVGHVRDPRNRTRFIKLFYIIPFVVFFVQYSVYHYERVRLEREGFGFWQMRRSWEDVQKYVQKRTPQDAVILVPFDVFMGGFRIHSEREIVVSERDCGIVGFDFKAAQEWKKRAHQMRIFNIAPTRSPTPAVRKAILRYGADYVVFMRYAAPGDSAILERMYTNMDFVLFKVTLPAPLRSF
jgi:hypothetical protein